MHKSKTSKKYEARSLTMDIIKGLEHGDILHSVDEFNVDGTHKRFKVNGKVKFWKRDPTKFKIPVKRGMYEYGYITPENVEFFKKPKRGFEYI